MVKVIRYSKIIFTARSVCKRMEFFVGFIRPHEDPIVAIGMFVKNRAQNNLR